MINAYQNVSDINKFDHCLAVIGDSNTFHSVSDSLGRLAAESQCMTSVINFVSNGKHQFHEMIPLSSTENIANVIMCAA